jgi:hypothetical protein
MKLYAIVSSMTSKNQMVYSSNFFHKKERRKNPILALIISLHLVILEGTFSDDMMTTGMSLRDDDSCKIRRKGKKNP